MSTKPGEVQFDCGLVLNPELIAVIGNKGGGKSALADILGLVGNTPRSQSFGFLREDRFRDPRNNKARHFEASLRWADGTEDGPVSLAADPVPEAVEKIWYVPQNYLEEICNEVSLGRESAFYGELQQVIFSHVAESERLGFETLDELLGHKGEEVSKGIDILVSQLGEINREIVALEERLTARHRKGLEMQLAEKRRALDAHEQRRPSVVPKPGDDPDALQESQRILAEVEAKQGALYELETEIRELRSADGRLARRRTAAERLATKLRNLQLQVDTSLNEAAADLAEVDLTRDQVIRFEVMTFSVEEISRRVEQERAAIAANLDPELADSQEARRAATAREIETLQESLTAPQRAYQEYVQNLKDWEGVRDGMVGSSQQPGTIQYLEKVLGDLNAVPGELRRRERGRQRKALEILLQCGGCDDTTRTTTERFRNSWRLILLRPATRSRSRSR